MLKKSFLNPAALAAVLAVQVLVVMVLFWPGKAENTVEVKPLIVLDDSVDRIEISAKGETVVLHKVDGRWQVGEGLMANRQQLDSLLEKLAAVKTGWPAGTRPDAHARFQVTEDNFSRKIHLFAGDQTLYEVYLGSIVNLKQTHIRLASDDNVYAGSIAVYEIPTTLNAWMDTALLRPKGEITEIRSGEFVVAKQDRAWPSEHTKALGEDTEAGEATASFNAQDFAATLNGLRANGVVDDPSELAAVNDPAGDQGFVQAQFEVITSETTHSYELLKKGEAYYLRRDDYPVTFKIGKAQFDTLVLIASAQA